MNVFIKESFCQQKIIKIIQSLSEFFKTKLEFFKPTDDVLH